MSDRFPYGQNWLNYLRVVTETHISKAATSLASLVGEVQGKSFLDVGSGSGIHSLAALRLGASRVHSFDYDVQSVEASREMKRRFAPDADWTIEQGSALDEPYLRSLGPFDIVYSWGVLHTTGDMWRALDLVRIPARELLAVAVYHDCGPSSHKWKEFKRIYNKVPAPLQFVMELGVLWNSWGKFFIRRPRETWRKWRDYVENRGQTPWYDIVDWAGGYPFEFASTESVISFYQQRGCSLRECRPATGQGCDEYVFSIPATESEKIVASSYSGQSDSRSA